MPGANNFLEPAFTSDRPIFYLQTQCPRYNFGYSFPYQIPGNASEKGIEHPCNGNV